MIFTYQNRATSLYNKTNTKEKTNYIVADYKAPPSNIQANRSVYENTYIPNTNPPKFTKKLVTPQRNPIKHYRRELTRDFLNNPSSRQIIDNINMPGKIIAVNREDQNYIDYSNIQKNKTAPNKSWSSISLNSDGSIISATGDLTNINGDGKIYRSIDSGITWNQTSSPTDNWIDIACSDDSSKQAAITYNSIYISNDFGITWTDSSQNKQWRTIAMSGNGNVIAAGASGEQIYISMDTGVTWNPYGPTKKWEEITINADGMYLAAVANNEQIYVSMDYGITWNPYGDTRIYNTISMNSIGNIIVAGDTEYIWISTNYGINWRKIETINSTIRSLSISGDGSIILASVFYLTSQYLFSNIYVSFISTNFNSWKIINLDEYINTTFIWEKIKISKNGNVSYAIRERNIAGINTNEILYIKFDRGNTCNSLFKEEIYPNNEICFNNCNKQNNIIKSAQTNMSQDYCPSIKNIREKRGQTYENNKCKNNQYAIKNVSKCNNNYNTDFITNKNISSNGTTSISSYKQQYTKQYSDEINILNNNICCNNISTNINKHNNNHNNCYNNIFPNLTHRKSICN